MPPTIKLKLCSYTIRLQSLHRSYLFDGVIWMPPFLANVLLQRYPKIFHSLDAVHLNQRQFDSQPDNADATGKPDDGVE